MKVSEKDYQLYSSRVAWYYFKAGMTQAEIAEKLGLNRSRVINILNEARRDGTVSIHVQGKDAKLAKLEEALKKVWNLREVMVIPKVADKQLKENLSIAGAHFLETCFDQRGGLVGLGWGHTVSGITMYLSRILPGKTEFVTLCGGVTQYLAESRTGNVGAPLSGFYYPFHALPTPLLLSTKSLCENLLSETEVQTVMEKALHSDIALVGIGALMPNSEFVRFGYRSTEELKTLKKDGAVGEMHGEYFNASGEPLELEQHQRLISIRLNKLCKIKHVVGVAGGADKIEAIRAALKGGYIHSLITDEKTAWALLNS
ncbi:MAG: sugar-binding domain-containing protein [SAR324 cluster bacterium]|nr:sugar-binding domain-containing protein [SAR324 cluster bacterium]